MKLIGFYILIVLLTILRRIDGIESEICVCGEANVNNPGRIVNGISTSPNKYPWMAAMFTSTSIFMCGGAIISDRTILTAGHCIFYTPSPLETYWVLGMHNQHVKDGDRYRVGQLELHPKFINHTVYDDYDIALVTLKSPIRLSERVNPICLPDISDDFTGMMSIIAGWGKLSEEKSALMGITLQESRIRILESETCDLLTKKLVTYNSKSMICGYAKNTDACQGDSGGPLFIETHPNRYAVFGTVSFGDGCARQMPGIYGRITEAETLQWIHSVIIKTNGEMCDNPHAQT